MQAQEQELELPEDMALDGTGDADEPQREEEGQEEGQEAPEANDDDAPEKFPEQQQRDAGADEEGFGEEADADADMADQERPKEGVHAAVGLLP